MKFIEPSLVGTRILPSYIVVHPGDIVQALIGVESFEGENVYEGNVFLVTNNSEDDGQVDLSKLGSGVMSSTPTIKAASDAPSKYALGIAKWRKITPKGKVEFVPCP